MRLRIAGLLLLGALPLAACRKSAPPRVPPSRTVTSAGALTILYAAVRRTEAAPPARFSAPLPLPRELDRFGTDPRFPPPAHVTDLLAAGDPEMHARLLASLREGVRQRAGAEELRKGWGELLRFRSEPALCAQAARLVVSKEPEAVRALFWDLLARCEGAQAAALFARPDAPGHALLIFANAQQINRRPVPSYSPAMAEAAARIILQGHVEARSTAFTLAELADPKAIEQLLRLHARAKDGRTRHHVAMALTRAKKDARAKAIAASACAATPRDSACDDRLDSEPPARVAAAATRDLAQLATAESVDVAEAIGKRRGPAVVAALEACALRNPHTSIRRQCLERLATDDRARAARLAPTIVAGEDLDLRELCATLARFPIAATFEARLRAAGVDVEAAKRVPVDEEHPGPPLVARDYLERGGRLHTFDTETGQFPNEHDSLLRELRARAGAGFPQVLFEEVPPGPGQRASLDNVDDSEESGPYTLVAYTRGHKLEVTAQNHGDWYDLEAVLALLNAVARDAGVDTRFAALATTDQTSHVVALSESALRAFAADGLLVFDRPGQGRELGRAFEDEVARRIEAR